MYTNGWPAARLRAYWRKMYASSRGRVRKPSVKDRFEYKYRRPATTATAAAKSIKKISRLRRDSTAAESYHGPRGGVNG